MSKKSNIFKLLPLFMVTILLLTACGGGKDPDTEVDSLDIGDLIGFYEGEWEMSPNMKPLASLVLLEDNKYEFYISIMGLMEEGDFELAEDGKILFIKEGTDGPAAEGEYAEGTIDISFSLNGEPTPISFTQVGSPDDVYKEFLGDYSTKVMGTTDVTLSLLPDKKYKNSLSEEIGTFKISGGNITLMPDDEDISYIGTMDLANKEMTIKMSVMPGTPEAEMTFKMVSEDEVLIYEGESTVGMSGSTPVQLIFKPGEVFEIITTKPRGVGSYEIKEEGDNIIIALKYTDPAARPDGTDFIMEGTMTTNDLSSAENSITIETVEYMINMDGKDSTMDLGEVTFTLSSGE